MKFIKNSNRWYKVFVYSKERDFFVTLFCDVSGEKQLIENNEETLRESEEIHRLLIENSHDIIYTLTADGVFIFVSPSWTTLLGHPVKQVEGQSLQQFVHPDDIPVCMLFLQKIIESGQRQEGVEYRVKHTDGSWRWHTTSAVPLRDEYGKVIVYEGIARDITERKGLEIALSNDKKLLETTLMSVGDGVISADNKGNIVLLNRVAEFLTGWTQEAARGKTIEEVFNIVNEFTREKNENIVKKVLESGKIHELVNHTILVSMDGMERPIEDSAAPIVQENGEIAGVVLVFRDCSEKRQKLKEVEFISYHDHLTGLYNRRFYEEELMRLDTERNLPISIVMGDVNGLKLINDSFGHAMGDELIKKVAEVIKKGCRADDIIARLGGDEYIIILPKTDALETEKIIKRINNLSLKEKVGTICISISFGHETKTNLEQDIQEIFKKAEDRMYKKKLFESPSMGGKIIGAIISTLYEKNKREEQHSHRVSALCKSMGEALGLPEYEIEELKSAGLLHDIGKIALDENILNKTGKLSDDEWKEIKRHPEIGYRILSTVNDMSDIANYVLYHHERWDGKGYPKGLKGVEIPFVSKIIAIADAYDAMTSERSYRSALPDAIAVEELQKNTSIQFDQELVRVFIEMVLVKVDNN